jgi:hypothetical protein
MQYGGMATMQSQGTLPNMMGQQQIPFQNTGMSAGQFANGGFTQPGFQMQMQPQITGMQQAPAQFPMYTGAQPNAGALGINRTLPAPLIPQTTAATLQPLQPQPTGPPPPVRFGVQKKLTPQPTGRANLTKASAWFPHLTSKVMLC